jgi:hypothetical protein
MPHLVWYTVPSYKLTILHMNEKNMNFLSRLRRIGANKAEKAAAETVVAAPVEVAPSAPAMKAKPQGLDDAWEPLQKPIGEVFSDVFGPLWNKFSSKEKENVAAPAAAPSAMTAFEQGKDIAWKELELTPMEALRRAREMFRSTRKEKRAEITNERQVLAAMPLATASDAEAVKKGIGSVWNKIKSVGKEAYLKARYSILGGSAEADLVMNNYKLKNLKEDSRMGKEINPGDITNTETKIRELQERLGSKLAQSKEFMQRANVIEMPVEAEAEQKAAA